MVCLLLLIPGKKSKKHDKSHKKYKKYKNNFVKPNDFYANKKNVSKKYVKQRSGKGKCFNCGKPGHFSKDCKEKPGKLKNKFNMLNIDDKEQEELFRILESNNSFDFLEDDFLPSSDSCYNVINSVNAFTKSEEDEKLIIQLINQIQNPELQKNIWISLRKI